MRIVHVSDAYVPRVGGMETQVHSLAQQQAQAGHEVFVLTATLGRTAAGEVLSEGAVEAQGGVQVHRLAREMPGEIPVHPRQGSLILATLDELKPDVVHCHAGMLSPFTFSGIQQASRLELPTVVTWHSTFTGWSAAFKAKARASNWDREPIAWTAVGSPGVRHVTRMLHTRRSQTAQVNALPNGVDLTDWTPSVTTSRPAASEAENVISPYWHAPSPHRVRVIATQRLELRKRTLPLLRATARARELVPGGQSIELLIVGTGSQDGAVRRWIDRNNAHDWVARAGKLKRSQLRDLYQHADIFAAPADLEAFGIAALEARAAGLAVVGRSGSGVADFIEHRVNGLLASDDESFAAALAQLASEPGLLDAIKETNRLDPPAFDWDTVLAKTDQEYLRAQDLRKTA